MSERSKGDTSSSLAAPPTSARVVKNPLLSASVTGLTFDDFQNKLVLLPAAPPIVHPVPVVSSRESTPLVTVGKSSEIDSENLSEINLNDTSATSSSNIADTSDENSNSLLESTNQVDNSILSQAASSFSQLPSVASTVFSTFSKKFNSSSTKSDINSNPQLDIQPFSAQFAGQGAINQTPILPPPSAFESQQQYQQTEQQQSALFQIQGQITADPPTFYTPAEVASAPIGFTCPPPASGQNTYRLSAKKKLYAPIPGLASTHLESTPQTAAPGFLAPIGFETAATPVSSEQSEDRKGGLFSLTNLGVPNVLQNLSGYVQSATGLSQRTQETQQRQPLQSFEYNQIGQVPPPYYNQPSQVNFPGTAPTYPLASGANFTVDSGVPSSEQVSPVVTKALGPPTVLSNAEAIQGSVLSSSRPPSAGNQFEVQPSKSSHPEPPSTSEVPQDFFNSGKTAIEQHAVNFDQTYVSHSQSAAIYSVGQLNNSAASEENSVLRPQATLPQPPNFFAQPPPSETVFSGATTQSNKVLNIFDPTQTSLPQSPNFFAQSSSTESTFAGPQLTTDKRPGFVPPLPLEYSRPPTETPSQLTGAFVTGLPLHSSNISQQITGPPSSQSLTPESYLTQQLPPHVKPPSAGPPATSFRLQKGTRLYKSPFAAAIIEYQQHQIPLREPSFPPAAESINFFNPQPSNLPFGLGSSTAPLNTVPLQVQTPVIEQKLEQSSLDTTIERPLTTESVNFFNPQAFVPLQTVSSDESVKSSLLKQTPAPPSQHQPEVKVTNPIQDTYEGNNFFHSLTNQVPESIANQAITELIPTIDTKSETIPNSEKVKNPLEDQQSSCLPPPPANFFGTSVQSKETANFPPPPPQQSIEHSLNTNPYRKGLQAHHTQQPAPSSLSSFFTPKDQSNHTFKPIESQNIQEKSQPIETFFAKDQEPTTIVDPEQVILATPEVCATPEELTEEVSKLAVEDIPEAKVFRPISTPLSHLQQSDSTDISPVSITFNKQSEASPGIDSKIDQLEKPEKVVSFYKPDPPQSLNEARVFDQPLAFKPAESAKIASPLKLQENPVSEQKPAQNLFSGFFDQAAPALVTPTPVVVHRPSLPDPTTFFDSFSLVPSLGIAAPPPEDPNSQRIQNFFNNPPPKELDTVGDLNYNLVGSGLSVQNLQIRSLTPASNLAEPPSSSCSEFSELNSSLSAAHRQPLNNQAADSTKVSPEEEAVFESQDYHDLPEEIVNELKMANSLLGNNSTPTTEVYKPAVKHWFYKRKHDTKIIWTPFSYHDSALLEEAFSKGDEGPKQVAVEGGRFDVNISERTKSPVYWEGEHIEVKRCSWFYKASDSKYIPYEEEIADLLEEEYKKASESSEWHKKIPISAGDIVVFHGPSVIVHFQPQQQIDSWGGSTQTITRPRVVKRDLDDFTIDEGESHKVDHLLFMVHGIGSACDLKMRPVEEVVDEFRSIALQLVQSHYKNSVENGLVGRVEVLPVSWHSELHSDELGIDEKLKSITLESIPKLRNFTNDTLLDILFYTSPMFCQRIINTVTASMNSIFVKYKQRNPNFHGGVSLAGHSLGSLIMFDLLCHQRPHTENEDETMKNPDDLIPGCPVDSNQLNEDSASNITYKMGQAGTGQPFISYPQLLFQPNTFFALGSPIGMFVTIRGIDKLGLDFRLPTCPAFYNIFHPYDPVAYRIEALVNSDMNGIPPVLIPHHKGRKRMHLELKETMSRVGADLKQRFFETFKNTIDSVNFLTPKAKNDPKEMEKEIDKVLELQAHQEQQATASTSRSRANSNSTSQSDTDVIEIDFPLGKLNDSKRFDYVLQEAPLEFINEYLFALSSHVCYWESEDTILFVMKQIYSGIGFSPDSQVPQQTMTIERPSSRSSTTQQSPIS